MPDVNDASKSLGKIEKEIDQEISKIKSATELIENAHQNTEETITEAEKVFNRVLRIRKKQVGVGHKDYLQSQFEQGVFYYLKQDFRISPDFGKSNNQKTIFFSVFN